MCPLPPLWRDARSHIGRPASHAGTAPAWAGSRQPANRDAKAAGRRAWELLERAAPKACTTAFTISLGTPAAMAEATTRATHRPLLKIKLGGDGDGMRIAAVRKAAPNSELIVDANEAWSADNLAQNLAACADAGVTLVEQPLPAGKDDALARIKRPVAVCAD